MALLHNSIEAGNIIQALLANDGIVTKQIHDKHKYGTHINLVEPSGLTHHVKFARSPFRTFGYYFPSYRGEQGDSLEEKFVDELKDQDWIYFCYPNAVLRIRKKDFVKPNLWRETSHGAKTCSYPLEDMEIFKSLSALG